MFLNKAATKHHNIDAGLLFQTNNGGTTACQRAFKELGKDNVMQIIGDCIPFDSPQLPILHHVVKHAQHLMNDFYVKYHLSAVHYSRDDNGHNLEQTLLASKKTTFKNNGIFLICTLTGDDPFTDLYPVMVAVLGTTGDLSAAYVLLRRRNPSLVRDGNPVDGYRNSSNRREQRSTRSHNRIKHGKQK